MTLFDIFIVIVLGYNAFLGLKQGAIRMLSSLIGILLTFGLTKQFFPILKPICITYLPFSSDQSYIYFGICFAALFIGFQISVQFLHSLLKWTGVGFINHILGCFIGLIRGTIFSIIIIIPLTLTKSSLISNSSILYDLKPFIDILILKLTQTTFFSSLLNALNLPLNPFQ